VDEPDACVRPAVNTPFMAFGLAEPPFQIQVVARQFVRRAQEEARPKAVHQPGQVAGERVSLLGEPSPEFLERAAAFLLGTVVGGQRVRDGLEFLHPRPQLTLHVADGLQPAVDAGR
jgi:hypothetical protein